MAHAPMTDEERDAKREAKRIAAVEKRNAAKAALREEILALASKIPPHVAQGGGTDGSGVEGVTRRGYLNVGPLARLGRPPPERTARSTLQG